MYQKSNNHEKPDRIFLSSLNYESFVSKEHFIRTSPFLHIHEDTLKSILQSRLSSPRSFLTDWTTPIIAALALFFDHITFDFKDVLSIPAASWKTIHLIILIAISVWAIGAYLNSRCSPVSDKIINDVRKGAVRLSEIKDGDKSIELVPDQSSDG